MGTKPRSLAVSVVERVLQAMRKGAGTDSKGVQFLEQMKTGCPTLPG